MGTISTIPAPDALSILTAEGAPLAKSSSLVSQSILESASPTDLASLSKEAAALSRANGLFGVSTPDFFQASNSGLLSAVYGLTPPSTPTEDLLQQGLNALYGNAGNPAGTTGNVINTLG